MCYGSIEEVHVLKRFLHWFEIVSGLKINYSKCEMLGLRMDTSAVSAFCFSFGCKVKSLSTQDLGMPLCIGMPKKTLWEPVIAHFEKKLSS